MARFLVAIWFATIAGLALAACSVSGSARFGDDGETQARSGADDASTGSTRPDKSRAEIRQAGMDRLMLIGVALLAAGVLLAVVKKFGGAYALALKVIPLGLCYGLAILGGALIAWASLPPTAQVWIFIGCGVAAAAAFAHMARDNWKMIKAPAGEAR